MIINHKPNLLYDNRMVHKHKKLVKDEQSSNNYNAMPLSRESSEISFKGISFGNIKKAFSFYNKKQYNLENNISFLKKYIGKAPEVLNNDSSKWEQMKNSIRRSADGKVTIYEKNWTQLLMEGIVYPVTDLPFHIAKAVRNSIKGKNGQSVQDKAAKSKSFIQNKFNTLNNDDIVNSFNGYMESAEKFKYDSEKVRSAGLFSRAMKMFDPKSGNYNAVHERALTRIVTGFIPAFFLANDAYNLSRICDDDAKAAEKEKKLRFNQETKRVLSNAYLQLITLGALSKYINRSKGTFIGVTAASVLLTESFSRLSNGKKLWFINKEEALKMNARENAGKTVEQQNKPVEKEETKNQSKPGFKGSKVFNGFGIMSDMPMTQMNNVAMSGLSDKAQGLKEVETSKPLLTLPTIAKWFVGTVALGFALKHAKGVKLKNGAKIADYFDVISKKYDSFYNKLTQKDYKIKKEDFKKITEKLENYDKVIAEKIKQVTLNYQKTEKVKSVAIDFAKELRAGKHDSLAEIMEHIGNIRLDKSFDAIPKRKAAEAFFKQRDNKLITQNIKEFLSLMENKGFKNEAAQIRELILDKNGNVLTENYTKTQKLIKKIAKDFSSTFENRFKIDADEENYKLFKEVIAQLKQKDSNLAQKYDNLVENAVNTEELSFGKKNTPMIREVADFITEPFKFIWGTITLPYKHIAKPFSKIIKPDNKLPEWDKEIKTVSNAISRITHKSRFANTSKMDLDSAEFSKYMNKQIHKAFNTSTMSSLSNSDLSALAKNTSTAATAWFLMSDNHNMVMQKTNGEDKQGAVLKAKERAIQETSRTFYNVMFINLFNNTFRSLYNSSLFGAQTVNTASTLVGEYVNRKAIGMPVKASSRDEILNQEYENLHSKGIKGDVYRFMSRLTGKKVLSQRETKKPAKEQAVQK